MKGGAWPFLVGGVICLVNSDNERDLILLNSPEKCFGISSISFFGLVAGFCLASFPWLLETQMSLISFLTS